MHLQRLTFDRVFSVVRQPSGLFPHTDFGFEAAGLKVYSAQVRGHLAPPVGVQLVVATRKPAAWGDMLGWADLTTGEVVVEAPGVGTLAFLLSILAVPTWMTTRLVLDVTLGAGRWGIVITSGVGIAVLAHAFIGGLRLRRARSLLKRWVRARRAEEAGAADDDRPADRAPRD